MLGDVSHFANSASFLGMFSARFLHDLCREFYTNNPNSFKFLMVVFLVLELVKREHPILIA